MKKRYFALLAVQVVLLCGCGETKAENAESTPTTTNAATSTTQSFTDITTVETKENAVSTTKATAAVTESAAVSFIETAVTEPDITEEEASAAEVFSGILIDEDCSDFEDPPKHDLPCMLMDSCRASGYGLDIQQEDGSWLFYMFDDKGQELSWDYLTHTDRMDKLYVTVTGKLEDGIIYVEKLEEN